MRKSPFILFVVALLLAGCSGTAVSPPTGTQLPEMATIQPTTPSLPMPTSTPTTACDAEPEDLKVLRELIPYEEFAMTQYVLEGERALALWLVNPEIDVTTGEAGFNANFSLAVTSTLQTLLLLRSATPCVMEHFDTINPIMVDTTYNNWFAGIVDPANIPADSSAAELDSKAIFDIFTQMVPIQEAPKSYGPPPAGTCDWETVQQNLLSQGVFEGSNSGAYLIIDQAGVSVWVQWEGSTESTTIVETLNTLSQDISCLHPQLDQVIFIIVDEEANAKLIGSVPGNGEGLELDKIEVLRQGN